MSDQFRNPLGSGKNLKALNSALKDIERDTVKRGLVNASRRTKAKDPGFRLKGKPISKDFTMVAPGNKDLVVRPSGTPVAKGSAFTKEVVKAAPRDVSVVPKKVGKELVKSSGNKVITTTGKQVGKGLLEKFVGGLSKAFGPASLIYTALESENLGGGEEADFENQMALLSQQNREKRFAEEADAEIKGKMVELPKNQDSAAKPAQLSQKAQVEAKSIPAEKSEGMSNMFAQAVGGVLPILIGAALGGSEGAVGVHRTMTEERKRQDELARQDRQLNLQEVQIQQQDRLLDIKEQVANNELLKLNAEKNPSLNARLQNLKGEDKKSLGNVIDARQAILDMNSAMRRGVNKFKPVGDNLYTEARTRFVESIARLKSGAAISEKEFDIYTGMTPSSVDEREVVKRKMDRILSSVDQRFQILGFNPDEFEFKMDAVATALDNVTRDQILAEKARRQQGK